MSTSLTDERISGPMGVFRVSTIQTVAGGGADYESPLSPFADSDFVSITPWPYETMVFSAGGGALYHEPYATEPQAREGHARIVGMIEKGLEFPGETVRGPFGIPTMTPEQWQAKQEREQ